MGMSKVGFIYDDSLCPFCTAQKARGAGVFVAGAALGAVAAPFGAAALVAGAAAVVGVVGGAIIQRKETERKQKVNEGTLTY